MKKALKSEVGKIKKYSMKFYNEWKKLLMLMLVVFLVGIIGRFIPLGSADWNFLFENMIWFPFEILITIFALNKILDERAKSDKLQKEQLMFRGKDRNLMVTLKMKICAIVYDDSHYDPNRNTEKNFQKIMLDIKEEKNELINDDLISQTRKYVSIGNSPGLTTSTEYNYRGICFIKCSEALKELNDFLDRYYLFIDEELYIKLDRLRDNLENVGLMKLGFNYSLLSISVIVGDKTPLILNLKQLFNVLEDIDVLMNERYKSLKY